MRNIGTSWRVFYVAAVLSAFLWCGVAGAAAPQGGGYTRHALAEAQCSIALPDAWLILPGSVRKPEQEGEKTLLASGDKAGSIVLLVRQRERKTDAMLWDDARFAERCNKVKSEQPQSVCFRARARESGLPVFVTSTVARDKKGVPVMAYFVTFPGTSRGQVVISAMTKIPAGADVLKGLVDVANSAVFVTTDKRLPELDAAMLSPSR